MAGAMRRMGIYLGLVEDDEHPWIRPVRLAAVRAPTTTGATAGTPTTATTSRYADDGTDEHYEDHYDGHYADDEPAEPVREPEPVIATRRVGAEPSARPGARPGPGRARAARRVSAMGSGPVRAAGLAVREPVVAVAPEPAPAAARPQPYRITTLHPRTYNEARTIGERFRDGMPVIMNLTEMDDADAKRLVDFAAGLVLRAAR